MTLSTGVQAIDRTFGGGIPAGSLVALTAPPEAQVGPLLHAGVHVRPTLYFTTIRTEAAIREELGRVMPDPKLKSVQHVGVDGALVDILAGVQALDTAEDAIVAILDPLEETASQEAFVTFLNDFSDRLQETGSIGIVHCLDTEDTPANRKLTLAAADFVWQLRCERSGRKLSYSLDVPKASGITLPDEDRRLDLHLGETVTIDTSRDIA